MTVMVGDIVTPPVGVMDGEGDGVNVLVGGTVSVAVFDGEGVSVIVGLG